MKDTVIFHIDVNSAYLSWTAVKMLEEGSDRDIRTIPAIVGGDRKSRHGIVLAKSVAAKKYGIVTGEPIVNALRKCPNLEIVPPQRDYYEMQSERFIRLLKGYTPDIEQVSIDECYLDFTGIQHKFPSPIEGAYAIKDTIRENLGFTVNVGISDVKVLAKMASDFTKPDRVHTLYQSEIQQKMWGLPVEDLFMAGKSSVNILHKLGISTIGQLAESPVEILESHLKSHGRILWEYANGIDETPVNSQIEELKGVGNSTTLSHDVDKIEEIEATLLKLSEKVGSRLRSGHQMAKTVAVEVKYNNFTKASRQTTVDIPIDSGTEIYGIVKTLFKELWNGIPVRLLGVRTANLVDEGEPEQMSILQLLSKENSETMEQTGISSVTRDKLKKLDKALDQIKEKYGENVVERASLLKRDNTHGTDNAKEQRRTK